MVMKNCVWFVRVVTHSQNHHNGHFQKNNTSGYKGVYWNKKDKKWVARIKVDGKPKFLGYYQDKKIAALAYNTASISYHGKFGSRNDLS